MKDDQSDEAKKMADEEFEQITTGPFIPITSVDQLKEMARLAQERKAEFDEACVDMTITKAEFVRKLRVDDGYTWRGVAQKCYDEWKGDWEPPSNQLMGMAICEKAAKFFAEDYMREPWN